MLGLTAISDLRCRYSETAITHVHRICIFSLTLYAAFCFLWDDLYIHICMSTGPLTDRPTPQGTDRPCQMTGVSLGMS